MTLDGIDVSHHQRAIDWAQVAQAGYEFAWVKATEGLHFVDSRFDDNWSGMAAISTPFTRGAYHFLRSDSDPAAQARHFVSVVGDLNGSMAAVDVESSGDSRPTADQARAFQREFTRLTQSPRGARLHPLVVYTGRWYWRGVLGDPYGADLGPLWHSAYSKSAGPLYGGWQSFTFWQFTNEAVVPGISGNVDRNIFYGGPTDLARLATRVTPPKQEEEDMFIWDISGRPALFFGPEGIQAIDKDQRAALVALGVEAKRRDDNAAYDAVKRLVKPAGTVDVVKLAEEISSRVDTEVDQAVVEAGVRAVLEHGTDG